MGRPSGSFDPETTRKIRWVATLIVHAELAGIKMTSTNAVRLVVQAMPDRSDMWEAISVGDVALPIETYDRIDHEADSVAKRDVPRTTSRRQEKARAFVARRERKTKTEREQQRKLGVPSQSTGSLDPLWAKRHQIQALERAYRDRGAEIESDVRSQIQASSCYGKVNSASDNVSLPDASG